MGSAISKLAGFKSLHAELEKLTIGDMVDKLQKDQSFMDINRSVVTEDVLVNEAIERASKNASGAIPIVRDGVILAVLDLPLVLDYLLVLFSDATDKKEEVTVIPGAGGFGGMDGLGTGMGMGYGNNMAAFHAFVDVVRSVKNESLCVYLKPWSFPDRDRRASSRPMVKKRIFCFFFSKKNCFLLSKRSYD